MKYIESDTWTVLTAEKFYFVGKREILSEEIMTVASWERKFLCDKIWFVYSKEYSLHFNFTVH